MPEENCQIEARLSSRQIGTIVPGLKLILELQAMRNAGESIPFTYTLYTFRLPSGKPSRRSLGIYDAHLMAEFDDLQEQFRSGHGASRRLRLSSVQIRAAMLSIRTYQDFLRYQAYCYRKNGLRVQQLAGCDTATRTRTSKRAARVTATLEKLLKRANRRERRLLGKEQHSRLISRWHKHLRWVRTHLTYFRRPPPLLPGRRKQRTKTIDRGVDLAVLGIADAGCNLPSPKRLRQFVRSALRKNRRFFEGLIHSSPRLAREALANYVLRRYRPTRLRLETDPPAPPKAPRQPRQSRNFANDAQVRNVRKRTSVPARRDAPLKPHRKRHLQALQEASTQKLLRKLRRAWKKLSKVEQAERLVPLLRRGCTLRGLATKLPVKLTTLRRRALLMDLPPELLARVRDGASAKRILAEFLEARRLELLARRLATAEGRSARVREIAEFIIRFAHANHIGSYHFTPDSEDMLKHETYAENRQPREDHTPKLQRQFRRVMLRCEPERWGAVDQPHLWSWLAITLVHIEPVHDLVESAIATAFAYLREEQKDKRSLKDQAADLWRKQFRFVILMLPPRDEEDG